MLILVFCNSVRQFYWWVSYSHIQIIIYCTVAVFNWFSLASHIERRPAAHVAWGQNISAIFRCHLQVSLIESIWAKGIVRTDKLRLNSIYWRATLLDRKNALIFIFLMTADGFMSPAKIGNASWRGHVHPVETADLQTLLKLPLKANILALSLATSTSSNVC